MVDYEQVLDDLMGKKAAAERQVAALSQAVDAVRLILEQQGVILPTGVSSVTQNNAGGIANQTVKGITLGDGSEKLLQEAGKPLHVTELLKGLAKMGRDTNARSLSSTLAGDPRKRFKLLGQNVFDLTSRVTKSESPLLDAISSQEQASAEPE